MAFNQLNVTIGAQIKGFVTEIDKIQRRLGKFQRETERIGTNLSQSISLPIAALGGSAIKSFADIEKLEKGLIALLGSADKAAIEMEKLREVAKLPGLGLEEAIKGSVQLQAVGLNADEARRTLLGFGKAVAVSGGGREDFNEVNVQLVQMISKNRILAEDFKVLQSRIPILGTLLQDAFGTRNITAIRDTGIGAKEFVNKILEAAEKSDILKNVTGGLANAFENFRDSLKLTLSNIGKEINKAFDLENLVNKVGDKLAEFADFFKNLDDSTKRAIVRFGLFAAAIGPVILLISKLSSGYALALTLTKSFVTGIAGIANVVAGVIPRIAAFATALRTLNFATITPPLLALTAAIGAAVIIYQDFAKRIERANIVNKTFADINKRTTELVADERVKIAQLVRVVEQDTYSKVQRKKAIEELKRISPEYLGQLDAEKSTIQEVKAATDQYVQSLLKAAKAQAAREKLVEIEKKLLDTQQQAENAGLTTFQKLGNAVTSVGNPVLLAAKNAQSFTNNLTGNVGALERARGALLKYLGSVQDLNATPVNTDTGGAGGSIKKAPEKIQIFPDSVSLAPLKEVNAFQSALAALNGFLGEQDSRLDSAKSKAAALGLTYGELSNKVGLTNASIVGLVPGIGQASASITSFSSVVGDLNNDLIDIDKRSFLGQFSSEIDEVNAKVSAYQSAINQAFQTGQSVDNIQLLIEQLEAYKVQLGGSGTATNEFFATFTSFNQGIQQATQQFEQTVVTGLAGFFGELAAGVDGTKALFGNLVEPLLGILEQVGRLAIETGIALSAIKKALKTLNPVVAIGAGVALIALTKFVRGRIANSAPKLADGGIAFGETLATVGEYAGARSNPEVIAPLDKLKDLIGSGMGGSLRLTGAFALRGTDLELSLARTKQEKERIR